MEMANTRAVYCSLDKQGRVTNKTPLICSLREKIIRTASVSSGAEKGIFIGKSVIIRIPKECIPESFNATAGDMLILGDTVEGDNDIALKKSGAVTIKAVTYNLCGCAPHLKLEAI